MNRLQRVALGEGMADLAVRNGRVLRPGGDELELSDVAVVGDRIATVTEDASPAIDEDTTVIDADGRPVVPGFIDAHAHEDTIQAFERSFPRVLEGGTTAVVSEVSGLGPAFGAEGVNEFLAATADLPVTVYVTVPAHPLVDTFEPPVDLDLQSTLLPAMLERDRVVGVGEIDWIHVVGRDTPAAILFQRASRLGLPVSGHGAGCVDETLVAFAQVTDNDHEAISADDHVARVENGLHSIGRYGSIRDDMPALAEAVERIGAGPFSLCTDGMWPRDLLRDGHMDAVLRQAIEADVEPLDAIRMATEHPADHFDLHRRGRIAPGSVADLVVLDDLASVDVAEVVADGDHVVRDGVAVVDPRPHDYPERFTDSVTLALGERPFRVPAADVPGGRARALAIDDGDDDHGTSVLTSREIVVEPPIVDGEFVADPEADVLKAACLNRHPDGDGGGFVGFVTGYGLGSGAVATTLAWELPALVVIGVDDRDMRHAVEHLQSIGGGWAVVRDGTVLADLPATIGGVAADTLIQETAESLDAVEAAIRDCGASIDRPLLAPQTLTFMGVPELRLCFSGYADVYARGVHGLAAD